MTTDETIYVVFRSDAEAKETIIGVATNERDAASLCGCLCTEADADVFVAKTNFGWAVEWPTVEAMAIFRMRVLGY